MHQPAVVSFLEGGTYLTENVSCTVGGDGTIFLNECLKIDALKQFHDVIESAIFRYSEIVEVNCVWRRQHCGCLRFPLETPLHNCCRLRIAAAQHFQIGRASCRERSS